MQHSSYHNGIIVDHKVTYDPCAPGSLNPAIHEFREFGEFNSPDGTVVHVGWIGDRATQHVKYVCWRTEINRSKR